MKRKFILSTGIAIIFALMTACSAGNAGSPSTEPAAKQASVAENQMAAAQTEESAAENADRDIDGGNDGNAEKHVEGDNTSESAEQEKPLVVLDATEGEYMEFSVALARKGAYDGELTDDLTEKTAYIYASISSYQERGMAYYTYDIVYDSAQNPTDIVRLVDRRTQEILPVELGTYVRYDKDNNRRTVKLDLNYIPERDDGNIQHTIGVEREIDDTDLVIAVSPFTKTYQERANHIYTVADLPEDVKENTKYIHVTPVVREEAQSSAEAQPASQG